MANDGNFRQKRSGRIARRYDIFYQHWKDFDLLTCILLMLGLFVAIVDYEINFVYSRSLKQATFIRVIVLILTILATVSLFIRQWLMGFWEDYQIPEEMLEKIAEEAALRANRVQVECEEIQYTPEDLARKEQYRKSKEEEKKKNTKWKKFLKNVFNWTFAWELMICVVHPITFYDVIWNIPSLNMNTKAEYVDVEYMLSDFLLVLMFFRIYFLLRTMLNYTIFTDLQARKMCAQHNVKVDLSFCTKALMLTQPGNTMVITSTLSILILSYILRIFEMPYNLATGSLLFNEFMTSIWCVVITMTTVGYGDVFAVTTMGRIVSIINALWEPL